MTSFFHGTDTINAVPGVIAQQTKGLQENKTSDKIV